MRIIAFDTETQGLPLFSEPSEHPKQPHIVELAYVQYDTDTGERLPFCTLIEPNGWTIPDEVIKIHGITNERAHAEGVDEAEALAGFHDAQRRADLRIAHNRSFDDRIMRIAYLRFMTEADADAFKVGKGACTQLMATPILKLPPTEKMKAAGRFHFKSANLTEAVKHFCGREHVGAHSALADAEACLDVWLAINAAKVMEVAADA